MEKPRRGRDSIAQGAAQPWVAVHQFPRSPKRGGIPIPERARVHEESRPVGPCGTFWSRNLGYAAQPAPPWAIESRPIRGCDPAAGQIAPARVLNFEFPGGLIINQTKNQRALGRQQNLYLRPLLQGQGA